MTELYNNAKQHHENMRCNVWTPDFFPALRSKIKTDAAQQQIIKDTQTLEELGCFAVVLECVPDALTRELVSQTGLITIGIGAGAAVDGQVLVMQDMLGFSTAFSPKFLRRYLDTEALFLKAFNAYAEEVKSAAFPDESEQY